MFTCFDCGGKFSFHDGRYVRENFPGAPENKCPTCCVLQVWTPHSELPTVPTVERDRLAGMRGLIARSVGTDPRGGAM